MNSVIVYQKICTSTNALPNISWLQCKSVTRFFFDYLESRASRFFLYVKCYKCLQKLYDIFIWSRLLTWLFGIAKEWVEYPSKTLSINETLHEIYWWFNLLLYFLQAQLLRQFFRRYCCSYISLRWVLHFTEITHSETEKNLM